MAKKYFSLGLSAFPFQWKISACSLPKPHLFSLGTCRPEEEAKDFLDKILKPHVFRRDITMNLGRHYESHLQELSPDDPQCAN